MPEILAPCGGKEEFFFAINSKCDAVFLGLSDFSARKNAENFTCENIAYYIAYAHAFSVKVYVCVNTLVKDSELEKFYEIVKACYLSGADAFIVQDVFLGKRLKKAFPNIVLHLSTQAGVNNLYGAKLALSYGFSRVVLARETSAEQIKEISKIIETEVFVHGALCSSFSGHCYASSFIGGNSGNRGLCRQPCRKKYSYSFNNKKCYALSLSDLCLADKVNELVSLGVSSFKIEGRMRSPEYVATSVRLYKKAINGEDFSKELSLAKKTYNRGDFTKGYTFSEDKKLLSTQIQGHLGEFVEKVAKFKGDKILLYKSYLKDCGFKILRNGEEVGNGKTLEDGNLLSYFGDVKIGDFIYLTKDTSLYEKLNVKRQIPLEISAEFFAGSRGKLTCNGVTVETEDILDSAKSSEIDYATVFDNLQRTDIYPYTVEKLNFSGSGAFLQKSKLNSLRKNLYEKLFYKTDKSFPLGDKSYFFKAEIKEDTKNKLAVITTAFLGDYSDKITDYIYSPEEYSKENLDEFLKQSKSFKCKKYLYLPAFLSDVEISKMLDISKGFDGYYVDSNYGVELKNKTDKEIFLGIETNLFNTLAVSEIQSSNIENYALSKELSYKELNTLSGFKFILGSIKIMSLVYCPNERNCNNCKVKNLETLTDYSGREFLVRRYKTSACRFEIFNESPLVSKKQFDKQIIDLSGFDKDFAKKLLDDYFNFGLEFIAKNYKHTNGNLLKGVL
ncbi:MAG: U32 family peptidase [Clostridia bacterium]|nr:U32 family peptidase [Clostridia bacterium]